MRSKFSLAGILDAAIEAVSPKWAAERKAWRNVSAYSYRGAAHGRTEAVKETTGSADYQLEQTHDRREMVDRARVLERDNVLASATLTCAIENIISSGIFPQATTDDPEWNAQAEALFAAQAAKADVRGLMSFGEMQALVYRSCLRDGDVGTILIDAGAERGKLQIVESDQIASKVGVIATQTEVDGIILDETTQRPTAYLVVANDPNDRMTSSRRNLQTRKTIPADSMVFLARRSRASQTRGLPIWAQTFWLFDQLDGYIEATTIAARMAACVGLVITQNSMTAAPSSLESVTGTNGNTYKQWSMEPGMIKRLQPGDSVTQIAPQQPVSMFDPFTDKIHRYIGAPLGLPLELVTRDFSKTNYSSARGALLQAYRTFQQHQSFFIEHWCKAIWRFWVRLWVEDGLLEDRPDRNAHEWIPPGWAWIDPTKEIQATMMAVEAGLDTLTDALRAQGRDFDTLVKRRQREREALEAAEIPDIRTTMTRDPMQPAATEDVTIKEADGE